MKVGGMSDAEIKAYLLAAPTSELRLILSIAVSCYQATTADCKFIAQLIVERTKNATASKKNSYRSRNLRSSFPKRLYDTDLFNSRTALER